MSVCTNRSFTGIVFLYVLVLSMVLIWIHAISVSVFLTSIHMNVHFHCYFCTVFSLWLYIKRRHLCHLFLIWVCFDWLKKFTLGMCGHLLHNFRSSAVETMLFQNSFTDIFII